MLKLNGVGDFPSLFALREYNSLDLEWRTNNSQVTTSMCSLLPDRNKSRLLCGTHRARGTGLADKLYTLPRGFRDQNAGPGAGWLVAAGVSKKKNGLHQFLAGSSFVEH